jgi:peptidoglycan/LPS O-acetylase OafA/YrhL
MLVEKNDPYYRPELDALRFFAFLCVFCFHLTYYLPNGLLLSRVRNIGVFGVPVFFLLSAFLITELLLRERQRLGKIHVRAFYMRRILRIWPLYFAAFFGLAVLNLVLPGVGTDDPRAWLAFTFFAGNWYIFHHGWVAVAVDPLWSISVEEQFYLVIPVLVAFGGRRILFIVSYVLLALAYLMVLLYAPHPKWGDTREWTNSFVHFQFFSAGTLIALLLRGRLIRLAVPVRLVGFVIGFCCWLAAVLCFHVRDRELQSSPAGTIAGWLLVLAGATLFFLCSFSTPSQWIPKWLSYLGRISYGLYVVHSLVLFVVFAKAAPYMHRRFAGGHLPEAIADCLAAVVVLALSIGLAHLSFQYFERPILRFKKRFTFIPAREEIASSN